MSLPIEALRTPLLQALARSPVCLLEAPPGAGKTTCLPLWLLDQPWLAGQQILLLQPRRLAARLAAERLAAQLGEPVGQQVGYRIRHERRISNASRLQVLTEGVLLRQLQQDPGLEGVGAILFDECHERSLLTDLLASLCLDCLQGLRPDLKLLLMSATLDAAPWAELFQAQLGLPVPLLRAEGRQYPVAIQYCPPPRLGRSAQVQDPLVHLEQVVTQALAESPGDLLVFLPGRREIHRAQGHLQTQVPASVQLLPLYNDLTPEAMQQALAPAAPGTRKVLLATNVAETSLTLPGIGAVIDSGLTRRQVRDPATGFSRMQTLSISRAQADQRSGRAGRLGPGRAYRLWSPEQQQQLLPQLPPAIQQQDLRALRLELALWGLQSAEQLTWLTPPPKGALGEAEDYLQRIGALEADGRVTAYGRRLAPLGLDVPYAHLALSAAEAGHGSAGAWLAALLQEPDPLRETADLMARFEAWRRGQPAIWCRQVRQQWQQSCRLLGLDAIEPAWAQVPWDWLLLKAFPDRLAQRRPGRAGQFLSANGRGLQLDLQDPLAHQDWLLVLAASDERPSGRIQLACALAAPILEQAAALQARWEEGCEWDPGREGWRSRRQRRWGTLVLEERDCPLSAGALTQAWLARLSELPLEHWPWSAAGLAERARLGWLAQVPAASDWPRVDGESLKAELAQWLGPYLGECRRWADLAALDWSALLRQRYSWAQQQQLQAWLPTQWQTPGGRSYAIDYSAEEGPLVQVPLQQCFGLARHPALLDGRLPLLVELLSPAKRPVQRTRDMIGFWRGSYQAVRKELAGRYPKHQWPEDPAQAAATHSGLKRHASAPDPKGR